MPLQGKYRMKDLPWKQHSLVCMNRGDREVLEETCLDSMYSVSKSIHGKGKQNDLRGEMDGCLRL